jgi:hypothetical protein
VSRATTLSAECCCCGWIHCLSMQFNTTGPSPRTYGMCFGDTKDWNRLGNPGEHSVQLQL